MHKVETSKVNKLEIVVNQNWYNRSIRKFKQIRKKANKDNFLYFKNSLSAAYCYNFVWRIMSMINS